MKTVMRSAATVLGVVLLMACGSSDEQVARSDERVPTRLIEAELTDSTTLNVVVASCNKQPTADVTEDDDVVRVTAYAAPPDPRGEDGCADLVTVRLGGPLGDRRVVDGSNDANVTILDESAP